jgi:probable rRNA maturation factor
MIEINNSTTLRIDKKFLTKITEKVLRSERKSKKDLSIALVNQRKIRELNKKYRKKNRSTDVLVFPYDDDSGEIVICLREVKKNAKKFKSTFQKELAKVLIHGILHLLGYKHDKNEAKAKEMRNKEEYYLSKVKI